MQLKTVFLAMGLAVGANAPSYAQTSEQTNIANAAIEKASAICADAPADCAAAVDAALAAMSEAGISGTALDGALGQLASALTAIGAELPAAVQTQIASALKVVLANLSPNAPQRQALTEIVAALESGAGATITAQIPSPT